MKQFWASEPNYDNLLEPPHSYHSAVINVDDETFDTHDWQKVCANGFTCEVCGHHFNAQGGTWTW